ncbi:MAG: hypothetical protein MZW92_25700 [Comamonadaceae bacterium]|nr:hypothetical protein [Comamonadaceae bacterium]
MDEAADADGDDDEEPDASLGCRQCSALHTLFSRGRSARSNFLILSRFEFTHVFLDPPLQFELPDHETAENGDEEAGADINGR